MALAIKVSISTSIKRRAIMFRFLAYCVVVHSATTKDDFDTISIHLLNFLMMLFELILFSHNEAMGGYLFYVLETSLYSIITCAVQESRKKYYDKSMHRRILDWNKRRHEIFIYFYMLVLMFVLEVAYQSIQYAVINKNKQMRASEKEGLLEKDEKEPKVKLDAELNNTV